MSLLARLARRATKPLRVSADRRRLGRLYSPSHDIADRGLHLHEAIRWLERAQDFGEDRGISYGAPFGEGFLPSYPETTGYIMQTFVELARRFDDPKYLDRARLMGDWEIEIQLPSGAVMGGIMNKNPTPAIFNTGQVLLGWSALLAATGADHYAHALRKASDWMEEMQEPDGSWLRGNSDFALKFATVYNVKAAWGLCEAGVVLGEPRYIDAATRNAEFCLRQQLPNGWYENCCLSDPARALLHTLAYAVQGLIGIGRLTGRKDFLDAANRTARSLQAQMRGDGFLSGRYDREFRGVVSWCCLTGLAQTSVVLSDLYLLGYGSSYREGVQRINDYLCRHHDVTSADPTIRGGVPGSWPVWGEYGQYMVLSWATKFFVDAMLREEEAFRVASWKTRTVDIATPRNRPRHWDFTEKRIETAAGRKSVPPSRRAPIALAGALRLHAQETRREMAFRSWLLNESVGRELEGLSPHNPFATRAYAKAMQALGWQAWILGESSDLLQTACLAFLRRGRLNTSLEIPSFPGLSDPPTFVEGLQAFCRGHGVTRLDINTCASPPVTIPTISADEVRAPRQEFPVDLHADLFAGLRVNHRRNVRKATQAGIQVRVRRGLGACVDHVRLVGNSIDRRIQRGEDIQRGSEGSYLQTARALIDHGAGFLAQAVLDERVLSSLLILRSARGAYYQSAGTSPEGMEKGASHFLIHEMLLRMKADSCSVFHLGGASPGTSLALFKIGFGGKPLTLERSTVYVGSTVRKRLTAFIQLLRVHGAVLA